MPWCPVCRKEYGEGVIECTDCGATLVEKEEARVIYHAYQNSADKARDNRSSAYSLLAVGGIGFIAVLLVFFGVIPVYQNTGITRYMICGIMGAMFILFIVFGFVSMKASKLLLAKAETEDSLMSEMTKWCDENLSAADIDDGLFDDEQIAEEQKYFRRVEKMKNRINEKFLNLDEAFLEHFVDDYYLRLFEET